MFGVSESDIQHSLNIDAFMKGIVGGTWSAPQSVVSSGRSGSFLWKTEDNFLLIKSILPAEANCLKSILRDYYHYLIEHRDSLLTRYYAFFELSYPSPTTYNVGSVIGGGSRITTCFVVMENCLFTELEIHELYDLKGSTVNRSVPPHERSPSVALKDMDFRQNKRGIVVGKSMSAKLLKQLESDAKFLSQRNILDYSLLVGFHFGDRKVKGVNLRNRNQEFGRKSYRSIFQHRQGGIITNLKTPVWFFVGLIDMLTPWDVSKLSEYSFKTLVLSQDPMQISAVKPDRYFIRFMEFMHKIIK